MGGKQQKGQLLQKNKKVTGVLAKPSPTHGGRGEKFVGKKK